MKLDIQSKVVGTFGVQNQYVIDTPEGQCFQSYDSIVAFVQDGTQEKVYLDWKTWDYSRTTLKYLKQFLGVDSKDEIRKHIQTGEYTLADLN